MVSWARAHDVRPSDFPYDEMKALYRKEIESEFPDASPDLPMTEAEFHSCLDPKSILEKRQTAGSANPKETSAMLSEQEARIAGTGRTPRWPAAGSRPRISSCGHL